MSQELYLAARTAVQAAQEAYRIARENFRRSDPEAFRLIAAGEAVNKSHRTGKARANALQIRRSTIVRAVKKHWSFSDPNNHDANWDECCRIGEVLKTAGLYSPNSFVANSIRTIALEQGLMNPRPSTYYPEPAAS